MSRFKKSWLKKILARFSAAKLGDLSVLFWDQDDAFSFEVPNIYTPLCRSLDGGTNCSSQQSLAAVPGNVASQAVDVSMFARVITAF